MSRSNRIFTVAIVLLALALCVMAAGMGGAL
jgi:hypothetical protein